MGGLRRDLLSGSPRHMKHLLRSWLSKKNTKGKGEPISFREEQKKEYEKDRKLEKQEKNENVG